MKRILPMLAVILLLFALWPEARALEFTAPEVPDSGAEQMPEHTDSFAQGLQELFSNVLLGIRPDLGEALKIALSVTASVLLLCILKTVPAGTKFPTELAGTVTVALLLGTNANAMISLGAKTVTELSEYGKLLCPVLTAALAAQGGVTASTALYAGTAVFDSVLSRLIARLLVPLVYLFLALATASSAVGEDILKKMRDLTKSTVSWCLKTLLTVFTTYMGLTGVVSGTTDALALKATKMTISSVVPVVGGILSDASEAVLVGTALAKNAAGIYGILAILAVFLDPFTRIGVHYLVLKATAAVCALFGSKEMTSLIEDFSSAMGLLLAMTGSTCLMLLISTICFLKGVG